MPHPLPGDAMPCSLPSLLGVFGIKERTDSPGAGGKWVPGATLV